MTGSTLGAGRERPTTVPDVDVLDDVNDEVWPVLEQLARAMRGTDAELAPTLDAIVHTAVESIGPADYAGLVLVASRSLEPVAIAGEPVLVLDQWQRDHGSARASTQRSSSSSVHIPDTRCEAAMGRLLRPGRVARSPEHALPAAPGRPGPARHAEPVRRPRRTRSARSTNGWRRCSPPTRRSPWPKPDDWSTSGMALNIRQMIGQATGILMERHRLTAEAAFGHAVDGLAEHEPQAGRHRRTSHRDRGAARPHHPFLAGPSG